MSTRGDGSAATARTQAAAYQAVPEPLRLLVRSGGLIGTTAVSFTGVAARAYGEPAPSWMLAFVFTLAFASYAIDRAVDELAGRWPNLKTELRRAALALGVGMLALAPALAGHVQVALMASLYPASIALYARVKTIPYTKAFYVAALWGFLVLFPAMEAVRPCPATIFALFFWVAGKAFVGANTSDIKDVESDKAENVRTLATRWPLSRLLVSLQILSVALAGTTLAFVLSGVLPPFMLALELHATVVVGLLAWLRCASDTTRFYITEVALDGAYGLLLPLAILFQQ